MTYDGHPSARLEHHEETIERGLEVFLAKADEFRAARGLDPCSSIEEALDEYETWVRLR